MSNKLNDLIKDGKHQSPVLDPSIKNYLIDIDGTITEDVPNEEPERMLTVEPFPDALRTCNKWYDEGHIITFFTSRTEDLRAITEEWLNRHGFKYQNLLMNKPRGVTITGSTITGCGPRNSRATFRKTSEPRR